MRALKHILLPSMFCVVLLTGCAVWPYSAKHVVAVRRGNGTNIVERLIQTESGLAGWAMLKPCYAGPDVSYDPWKYSYFVEDQRGRRTRIENLTFLKQEKHDSHPYTERLSSGYYDVRPVMNTDLWLALSHYSSGYGGGGNRRSEEYLVSFHLYVFDAHTLVRDREWKAIPWSQSSTNGDFQFDATNQRITYSTTRGFETYDLLRDAVSPGRGGQ